MESYKTLNDLEKELRRVQEELEEANDTIEAIRTGQIDALVVKDESGPQVFTLKSSDQTYRVFIERMKEGAVTIDPSGLILYSNSSFAAMVDYPLGEVIGSPIEQFIQPPDNLRLSVLLQQGWNSETKGEIQFLKKNSEALPALLSLATLELDEGEALSIIVTDLTRQKENELELRAKNRELEVAHDKLTRLNDELEERVEERTRELLQSREHFKFLADHIPIIVWTAKPTGELDYYNKKWYEYTGTVYEEVKNWGWEKVVHPDDIAPSLAAWEESLSTGKELNIEIRFLRSSDKKYRYHSGIAVPYKNKKGQVTAWFGICTDIEDQKAAMTKKDEFISMASHELKTPVTTLKGFAQLLISIFQEEGNIQAAEYMQRMDKQINKLTSLIADLLDASKANAGMIDYKKDNFDLNDWLKEVAEQMQLGTKTHSISLQLNGTTMLHGDRDRLSQVLSNIIANAIKYSPNADNVIVSTAVTKNVVQIRVQDFGIGIPQGQQLKLFNRFFRASEVKTNTFPGLGLGLYISNEIVKRHSGRLTFESKEGKGSTFCVELPKQAAISQN